MLDRYSHQADWLIGLKAPPMSPQEPIPKWVKTGADLKKYIKDLRAKRDNSSGATEE